MKPGTSPYVQHKLRSRRSWWAGPLFGLSILLLGGCAGKEVSVPSPAERGCTVMSSVMPQQVSPRDTEQTKRDALMRNRVWGAACPEFNTSSTTKVGGKP